MEKLMARNLMDLVKELNEVKKEINNEMAEPVQKLVNMVHAGTIKDINMRIVKPSNIGGKCYVTISVGFTDRQSRVLLGGGGETFAEYANEEARKNVPEAVKKQLHSVNVHLNAINDYLSESLNNGSVGSYYFSKFRLNNEAGWTPEVTKDMQMLPKFLEGLVDLNGVEAPKPKSNGPKP